MPDGSVSDGELIDRWRRGDELAAAELIKRHATAVARFLGASGGGDDVEDLVQEAFFRAFRSIARFRGGSSFRTWVMTIASNALKDLKRRARRGDVLSLEDRDVADTSADPYGETVSRDAVRRVEAELGRLPRLQREVFLLRAQEGLEYDEIARALGTTPGAARVHYHHAVQRLKRVAEA
ncbi:MAG: sigma-70 family RNA polymerase sigma factor [Gemmatimonadetes bacterium]|nr:sigma-70 family RNA polymerase sigma factor [Gemmatimonadota bacterium]